MQYIKYLNKYLELKDNIKDNQINNQIQEGGIYNSNGTNSKQLKSDGGAGIILIEKFFDYKKKKYRPVIILFKNKFFGMFEDVGGHRNKDEDLKENALREAQEESRNLFILPKKLLDDKKAVRVKNYVGYIVHIKGPSNKNLNLKFYNYNKKIMEKHFEDLNLKKLNKTKSSFDETIGIIRVYIDQLIKDGVANSKSKGDLITTDIHGQQVEIFSRTAGLIKLALDNNLIEQDIKQDNKKENIDNYFELYEMTFRADSNNNISKLEFLNGTKVYH